MLLNIQKNKQQGSLELLQQDLSAVSLYSKPSVVSRSGWGANETYMKCPPEYQSVTHNIIHHTDTPNTDTDWPARIRSIYYYHSITLGWGDIGYNYLVVTGTISSTGITAIFTPSSNLLYNTTYTVTIINVEDLAGNPMITDYTWSFRTGDAPDTTAPTVSLTNPDKNAEDVAINTKISVSFSEVINANTINTNTFILKDSNNNNVTGTVTYSDLTATFTPLSNLDYNKSYTTIIKTEVMDLSGNRMKDEYTWIFTTIASNKSNNGNDSGDSKKKGPCLITNVATKISYGTIIVKNLTKFKDEYLLNSLLGKLISHIYYKIN